MTDPLIEVGRDWTPVSAKDNTNIPAVSYREGKGMRGACRVVESALRLPSKPTVATTIHNTPGEGVVWSGTVERSRRGHAPERHITVRCDADELRTGNRANEYRVEAPVKNWSTIFRWYEQFQGTLMAPRVYPTPEEREQLRVALEGAPYVVKVGDRVTGMFAKREQAEHVVSRMGVRATLYHVGARYAWVEGATQVLPRSDRARGPSSVLAGQGSKTVRHKVVVGFDEQRIDPTTAHRLDNAMNGKEIERATFEAEKQWRVVSRETSPSTAVRKRYPAGIAKLAESGDTTLDRTAISRRYCRAS